MLYNPLACLEKFHIEAVHAWSIPIVHLCDDFLKLFLCHWSVEIVIVFSGDQFRNALCKFFSKL